VKYKRLREILSRRGAVPIMLSVIGSICSILGLLVTVLLAVLDRKK
jgi:hypothetical protein